MTTTAPGPEVARHEDLYRCLMYPDWYHADENRVSSAAFKWPVFSVDVASLAGSPERTLSRFRSGTGLVSFNCGQAADLGCTTRLEPDEQVPDNPAHAHVYMPAGNAQRKRVAQRLVGLCTLIKPPDFAAS
jgi:hypothetical protein